MKTHRLSNWTKNLNTHDNNLHFRNYSSPWLQNPWTYAVTSPHLPQIKVDLCVGRTVGEHYVTFTLALIAFTLINNIIWPGLVGLFGLTISSYDFNCIWTPISNPGQVGENCPKRTMIMFTLTSVTLILSQIEISHNVAWYKNLLARIIVFYNLPTTRNLSSTDLNLLSVGWGKRTFVTDFGISVQLLIKFPVSTR